MIEESASGGFSSMSRGSGFYSGSAKAASRGASRYRDLNRPLSLVVEPDIWQRMLKSASGTIGPGWRNAQRSGRGPGHGKPAPRLDRRLRLPDVLQKYAFGVVAAPAAGFKRRDEIFQPGLGQRAPALHEAARGIRLLHHERGFFGSGGLSGATGSRAVSKNHIKGNA